MNSIAVITCHFNWEGYDRPRANLVRFQRQMVRSCVPVYGLEAVLPHQTPISAGWPNWRQVQVSRRHVMFQKEAMLNDVERFVPHHFKHIAALDADLDFGNANWVADTLVALEQSPVAQPFSECVWMGPSGEEESSMPSTASTAYFAPHISGHPGFGWAFRRAFFRDMGGFFPWCVCGHGDIVNASAFYGAQLKPIQRGYGDNPDEHWRWEAWAEGMLNWTRRNVGCAPGTVYHEWHGSRPNRGYAKRLDAIRDLVPSRDLEIDATGLIRWTDDADPVLMISVANYFKSRKEDGEPQRA